MKASHIDAHGRNDILCSQTHAYLRSTHTQVYSIVYMHMHTHSVYIYIYTIYTSYIIHMFAKAGSRSD